MRAQTPARTETIADCGRWGKLLACKLRRGMIARMRSRVPLFLLLLLAGVAVVPHFAHAAIPFFGPIVPDTGNLCAPAWGMVITVVNNLIELGITLAIVFVAPIMIAYAGFLMVVEPMSPGGHTKARGILLNTVVGIVVALAAWLIVDAVMAALTPNGRPFGENWATIISSNGAPQCINIPATLNQTATGAGVTGVSANGSVYTGPLGQCGSGNTACSVSALRALGASVGQANAMSCIAVTESSGNPNTPVYNTVHPGSNSTACGTFQIVQTTWKEYASGSCTNFSNCTNATCNAQVAQALVSNHGYTDWTCATCNNKASACVQKYDPNGT